MRHTPVDDSHLEATISRVWTPPWTKCIRSLRMYAWCMLGLMLACFSCTRFDPLTVPLAGISDRFQTFRPYLTGQFWIFHFCQICLIACLDGLIFPHVYISDSCFSCEICLFIAGRQLRLTSEETAVVLSILCQSFWCCSYQLLRQQQLLFFVAFLSKILWKSA